MSSGGAAVKGNSADASDDSDEVQVLDDDDEFDRRVTLQEDDDKTRFSRKRKRSRGRDAEDEDEDGETVAELRARLKQVESERDYYKKRTLSNPVTASNASTMLSSRVHTKEIKLDMVVELDTLDGRYNPQEFPADYRSDPLTIDGISISVGIEEIFSFSAASRTRDPPEVIVTPHITAPDNSPHIVLVLINVTQQSEFHPGRNAVSCSDKQTIFLDKTELSGEATTFIPNDDLKTSTITIRITAVVHKNRLPDGGSDARTVVVQDKEFIVSASFLGHWSAYFRAYFEVDMVEKRNGKYPVTDNDISADDFQEMLLVIYPTQKLISEDNFEVLLKLANRFEMAELMHQVDIFLMRLGNHRINLAWLFKLATDEYALPMVQATLLNRWRYPDCLQKELLMSNNYKDLSPATKNYINQKFADNTILANRSSSPYLEFSDDDNN